MTLYFSSHVRTAKDMRDLEATIANLLKGEDGRCCELQCESFVRFRLALLYPQEPLRMQSQSFHLGPLRIVTFRDRTVEVWGPEAVYEVPASLEPDPASLEQARKRLKT